MAVYVDEALIPYGRMLMSHMIADTHQELVEMADKIGLKRRWIQNSGLAREHFDVSKEYRERAINHGAIPIDSRSLVKILFQRKVSWGPVLTIEGRKTYFA